MASFKLAALTAAFSAASAKISVNPDTRFFVDELGRTVLFHGVNVVYKTAPYIPSTGEFDAQASLNDEDIANLVKWG